MTATTIPAEFAAVEPALAAIREGYRAVATIKTPEQFTQAGELLKAVKGALRQIEDQRVAITKPINESLRAVNAQAKTAAEPFEKAEREIKARMVEFSNEQERIRREEQRKADERARQEREKLEAQAAKAAAAGKAGKAEQLEERAAAVVAPVVEREPPKVAGISTREVWRFEITDPTQVNAAFLMPDEKKIGAAVRAMKGDAAALVGPGVRVWSERQLAAGAA